jgi:hypothetical protein
VIITFARTLSLEPGNYALIGSDVGLFKGLVMPCLAGNYALIGSDASMTAHYIFALDAGQYILIGTNVGLAIITKAPECRTYTIDSEGRVYGIKQELRDYSIPFEDRTLEVKCH